MKLGNEKVYRILAKFNKPIYPEIPQASHYYYVLADSMAEAEDNVLQRLKNGGCANIKLETDVIFLDDIRK